MKPILGVGETNVEVVLRGADVWGDYCALDGTSAQPTMDELLAFFGTAPAPAKHSAKAGQEHR